MYRTAAQVFLLLLVMVVAVEECGGAGLATSTTLPGLTQEELVMSVVVNQMAILKDMNESSCVCASRDTELRELRLLKEEVKGELEAIKEEVKGELEAMKKVKGELETMKEEVEGQLRSVREMLETVQNASIITPSQQTDQPDLNTLHNDTDPSLCRSHKVLYGSKGSLSPSHPWVYDENMRCEWRVILPEGTHPVFRWDYINIEEDLKCTFDFVQVLSRHRLHTPRICGYSEPPHHHPMYSITDNEFTVTFSSDYNDNYSGFVLHYQAEIN